MNKSLKDHVLIILLMFVAVVGYNSSVIANEPTLSITQIVADALINDATGQEYQVEITNPSSFIARQVELSFAVIQSQSGEVNSHFSYLPGSLSVLLNDTVDITGQASVTGTGPYQITFDPGLDLNPTDKLTLRYRLATDELVEEGSLNILDVNVSTLDLLDQSYTYVDQESFTVFAGELTVDLTPINPTTLTARRGEWMTLECRVTNNGSGTYFFEDGQMLTTSWGTGFANPQLVAGQGTITPTLVDGTYQLAMCQLGPGETEYFQFMLEVVDYQDLGLTASTREPVGGDEFSTSESLVLLVTQPSISLQVIQAPVMQYGTDLVAAGTMEIQIVNSSQQGVARNFQLVTDFSSELVTISDVSPGWSYDPAIQTFTYDANGGVINTQETLNLTFKVKPNFTETTKYLYHDVEELAHFTSTDWEVNLIAHYTNDLEQPFAYPLVESLFSVTKIPLVLLSLSENHNAFDSDMRRVFLGEVINFHYTAQITELAAWDLNEDLIFTKNLSEIYAIDQAGVNVSAGSVAITSNGTGGNIVTWRMTPEEAFAGQTIDIPTVVTEDPAEAGTLYSTYPQLSGKTAVGYSIRDIRYLHHYLQNREEEVHFLYENKSITHIPPEGHYDVCGRDGKDQVDYQIHYEFSPTSGGTWTGSTYTDLMNRSQVFVPDSVQYKLETGDWINIPQDRLLSTSPLTIDLGFLTDIFGSDQLQGKIIDLRYSLKLTDATWASTNEKYRANMITESDLVVNNALGGDVVAGEHHFYQAVFVPIGRARMAMDLSLAAEQVGKGGTIRATLNVDKLSPWTTNNVAVTLESAANYVYNGNLSFQGFSGQTPTVTEADVDGDGENEIQFTFDAPLATSETGNIGQISFDLIKTGSDVSLLPARLDYTDDLNQPYTELDEEEPYLLEAVLGVWVVPQTVQVGETDLTWIYEVVNLGSSPAYNAIFTETMSDVLNYLASTVNDSSATPVETPVGATNELQWDLGDIPPGQSSFIQVTAQTSGLSFDFLGASTGKASYGWNRGGERTVIQEVLGNGGNDFPSFETLASDGFIKNETVDHIVLEDTGVLRLRIENIGWTTNYNLEFRQDLGTSFIYQPGSLVLAGQPVLTDPQIVGTELVWNYNDFPELLEMLPGEFLQVEYTVQTTEDFTNQNQISSVLSWQKPWETGSLSRTGLTVGAVYAVPRYLPEVTVQVDGQNDTTGSGYSDTVIAEQNDQITWRVQITNTGLAPAKNMTLHNLLPANMTFGSITGGVATPVVAGSSWKIGDLASGATVTYYIQGTFTGTCQPPLVNQADVSWGSQTSSLTTPGDVVDTATFITSPVIEGLSQMMTNLTTKDGHVQITIQHSGAPLYNLTVTDGLSNRYALVDLASMSYSADLTALGATLTQAPTSGTVGDTPLTWVWSGSIPPGTHTISFDLQDANLGASDASPLTPDLQISYEDSSGGVATATENSTSFTPQMATLQVDITPERQIKENGDQVSWTLTATNSGTAEATDTELVVTFADGYSNIASLPDPTSINGSQWIWSSQSIAAGGSLDITLSATVDTVGSRLVQVTGQEHGHVSVVSQDLAEAFTSSFQLDKVMDQITGNVDDPLADTAGEEITFTIHPNFQGNDTYTNIQIQDLLPAGMELVSQSVIGGDPSVVHFVADGKNLTWTIDDFSGTDLWEMSYVVRLIKEGAVATGSELINEAQANFQVDRGGTIFSYTPTDYPTQLIDTETVTFHEPQVDLALRNPSPASGSQVVAGQEIQHQILAHNSGTSPAYELRMTELLPIGTRWFDPTTTIYSVEKDDGLGGSQILTDGVDYSISYDSGTGELVIDLANTSAAILQPNETLTINYRSKVKSDIGAGVGLNYTASIEEYFGQPVGTAGGVTYVGKADQTVTFQTSESTFQLTRVSPADGLVTPGDLVTYQATFVVPQGTSVYDLGLENRLPLGVEYVVGSGVGPGTGTGGPDLGTPTPTVTGDPTVGQVVSWFGGQDVDITNAGGSEISYTITFDTLVLDQANVIRGNSLEDRLVYNFNTIDDDAGSRTSNTEVTDSLTVIEPDLTISQTIISSGPYEAGDQVTYQVSVNHSGASDADAYDLELIMNIPQGMTYTSMTPVQGILGATVVSGQEIRWGSDQSIDLAQGEALIFEVAATLDDTVEPNQSLASDIAITWTNRDGVQPVERLYTGVTDTAACQVADGTTISKSILTPPVTDYVIGETYTYQLVVEVNEGVTKGVIVADQLPAGIQYVSGTMTSGPNLSFTPNVTPILGDTGLISWELGDLANPDNTSDDDQIVITYQVQITNQGTNQAGLTKSSQGSVSYLSYDGSPLSQNSSDVQLVIKEPQLNLVQKVRNITKGDLDFAQCSAPDAGDLLEYQITLNNSGVDTATAYDLNLVVSLPEGVTYLVNSLREATQGQLTVDQTGTGQPGSPQTLVWGRTESTPIKIDLLSEESLVYTYQVEVLDHVTPGQLLTQHPTVDWTSLDGVMTEERTGVDGVGGLNDYLLTAELTESVVDGNSLTIEHTTDTFNPGEVDLRVGDVATFTIQLQLQEGLTPNLQVLANLPAGLEFVDTVSILGDQTAPYQSSGNFSYGDIPLGNTPVAGSQSLVWNLGDLSNQPDNLANDTLQVVFRAQVVKSLQLISLDQTLSITSNLSYTGKTRLDQETEVAITTQVQQPQLSITKTAEPADHSYILAGQPVTYTVTVTNTGAAPAYDLRILDEISEGMRAGGTAGITVQHLQISDNHIYQDRPLKNPTPNVNFVADGLALWDLDDAITADTYTILPGESLKLVYQIQADSNLADAQILTNRAQVINYYSFDEDAIPLGASVSDRVNYPVPASATVTHLSTAMPTAPVIIAPATGTIGEEIIYQLQLPGNGTQVDATIYDLTLQAQLPENMVLVSASFAPGNQATGVLNVNQAGQMVTITGIDSVSANQLALLELTGRITNTVANQAGTQLDMSAAYTYEVVDGGGDTFPGGSAMATVTVVEPQLTVTQEMRNLTRGDGDFAQFTTPDAGDRLEYRVTVANAVTAASTAYDLNLQTIFSEGIKYVTGTFHQIDQFNNDQLLAPTITGTGEVGSAQTLTWGRDQAVPAIIDLAPGEMVTFTYQVDLLDQVTIDQTLQQNLQLDWTSCDGVVIEERTGLDGNIGLNDYFFTGNQSFQTADLNQVQISRSTDTYQPADSAVRIGDLVTYTIQVNLQEGVTQNLIVSSELPAGLQYVATLSINGDTTEPYTAAGNFEYVDLTGTILPTVGSQSLSWNLGEVKNLGDNLANDQLAIVFLAQVTDQFSPTPYLQTVQTTANLTYLGKTQGDLATEVSTPIAIQQPHLTISQTAIPASGSVVMANQKITSTVTVENIGAAPAYDLQIRDLLPEGLRERGVAGVTVNSLTISTGGIDQPQPLKAPEANPTFATDGKLVWDLDDLSTADTYTLLAGEKLVLTYTLLTDPNLIEGLLLTKPVRVDQYYSLDDDALPQGVNLLDRAEYGPTAEATVNYSTTALPKTPTIVGPTTATIGETVTYVMRVPGDGSVVDTDIYDPEIEVTLPANIEFVSAQFASQNQGTGSLTVNPVGQTLTITGIDAIQLQKQAWIELTGMVRNSSVNHAGDQFEVTGSYTYELVDNGTEDYPGGSTISNPLTVLEPQLTLVQEVRPYTGGDLGFTNNIEADAGDLLEYRITLENGTNHAVTAYDLNLEIQLAQGLQVQAGTFVEIDAAGNQTSRVPDLNGTGATGSPQQLIYGSRQGTPTSMQLAVGEKITYSYLVKVLDQVQVGTSLAHQVTLDWTSLEGGVVGERDGSDGEMGLNNYYLTETTTVDSSDQTSLAISRTDDTFNSQDADLRIGDLVTFTIQVELMEGVTPNLTVHSTLPASLEYVDTVQIGGDVTAPYTAIAPFTYSDLTVGQLPIVGSADLVWSFGDVVNAGDNQANNILQIQYRAKVKDLGVVLPTVQVLATSANLDYATKLTDPAASLVSTDVVVKQPNLAIAILSDPAPEALVIANQLLTYTLTVTNIGDAPAYDLQIVDYLPVGLRACGLAGVNLEGITLKTNGSEQPKPVQNPLANPDYQTDGAVIWDLDDGLTPDTYTIQPGESLEIVYQIQADADLTAGALLSNQAQVGQYFSLDDDQLPAGVAVTERAQYGPTPLVTTEYQTVASPDAPSIINSATATIGEVITYQIQLPGDSISPVPLYDLEVEVTLPENVEVANEDFASANPSLGSLTISQSGQILTIGGIQEIVAGQQCILDLPVRILNQAINQMGSQFGLTATYSYRLVDGGVDQYQAGIGTAELVTVTEPILELEKVGPAFAPVNQPIDFTLTVTNTGTSTAWQPILQDQLPEEMRLTAPVVRSLTVGDPARELVEADDYQQTYDAETGLWQIEILSTQGGIGPNETLVLHYQTDLNPQALTVKEITNTAQILNYYSYDLVDTPIEQVRSYDQPGEAQQASATMMIQTPLIQATVQPTPNLAAPGTWIHYQMVVSNLGNLDETQAELQIDLAKEWVPGSLTNISTTSGTVVEELSSAAGGTNGTGTFTIQKLTIPNSGGTVTIEWDAQLQGVLPDQQEVLDQIQLQLPNQKVAPEILQDPVVIESAPEVVLTKQDFYENDPILHPGERISYQMKITNLGNENAVQGQLIDAIPSNTEYVVGSTQVNGVQIADIDQKAAVISGLEIEQLAVGEVTVVEYQVQVMEDVVPGTIIRSQARFVAVGEGANARGEQKKLLVVSDDPTTEIMGDPTDSIVGALPIIDAQKTVTDENGGILEVGDVLLYEVQIINYGSADATQVEFYDVIPEGTTYLDGSLQIFKDGQQMNINQMTAFHWKNSPRAGQGTNPVVLIQDKDVFIDLDHISANEKINITFKVSLDQMVGDRVIISQGTVVSRELPDELTDADGIDLNGDQPTEIAIGQIPLLRAQMQAVDLNGDRLVAGDVIEYTIDLRNTGNDLATGVEMQTVLPEELTYLAGSTMIDGNQLADNSQIPIEAGLNLGTLAVGELVNIRFQVRLGDQVASGMLIDLQAVYRSNEGSTGVSDSDLEDELDNSDLDYVLAHSELYQGIDSNNHDGSLNDDDPTRIQTNSNPGTANISGSIFWDADHDDHQDVTEEVCAGWTVQIFQKDNLVHSVVTDETGFYNFRGLLAGGGYQILIQNGSRQIGYGSATELTVHAGTEFVVTFPVEPTGIVYDAVSKLPVAGAEIQLTGPTGFDPELHLLSGQANQQTDPDGRYKLSLTDTAPVGDYQLTVIPPTTYSPAFPSTLFPPELGILQVADPSQQIEGSYLVVDQNQPVEMDQASYYLAFHYENEAVEIVNNHIPLDPILENAVLVTKTANKREASIGDLVQYTIKIENQTAALITPFEIQDHLPAHFKYVAGSARFDGTKVEPKGDTDLIWSELTLEPLSQMTLTYTLVVGTGVEVGVVYENRVQVIHQLTGTIISNEGVAGVKVKNDGLFTNTLVIGKVFIDENGDGIQQAGEIGVAGVELINAKGQVITTDEYGRYRIVTPGDRVFSNGESMILKVNPDTIPDGFQVISENPLVIRMTGVVQKVNFRLQQIP